MIIQIGGLLAKRVVSDNKFAKIMIIQIWRLPHRRRFGTTNLQTIMIFHIWQAPCIVLQSCSDHLNAPSTFKEDDDIDDHYIDDYFKSILGDVLLTVTVC